MKSIFVAACLIATSAVADTRADVLGANCHIVDVAEVIGGTTVFRPDVEAFLEGMSYGLFIARELSQAQFGDTYFEICRANPSLTMREVFDRMIEAAKQQPAN